MSVKFANNAVSTLASGINDSVTSITVASGDGALFPSLTGSEYFFVTLIDASNNLEIAKCTARSSDVLTVTRAQESTSARAFSTGDRIELRITAQSIVDATTSIPNSSLANSAITLNGSSVSLGGSATIGTDWQAVKTSAYTASAGEGVFANTSGGAFTLTLPSSPSQGDEVSFKDYASTFDTNNLTIGRNGKNIEGAASDLTISVEGAGNTLVFVDDTKGWLIKNK